MESQEFEFKIQDIAYDLRLTFSSQDKNLTCLEDKSFRNNCKRISKLLIEDLKRNGYFSKYTAGLEQLNKNGEPCPMHLHLRFESQKNGDSMRRHIKDILEKEFNQDTKGNKNFMFKAKVVRSYEEFYQYPLKQNLYKYLCDGFPDKTIETMHEVAKACYMKVMECNQAKLNRKDDSDTLFERAFKKCEGCKTQYEIAEVFLNFYMEENRPINNQVIKGYVVLSSLKLGLISKKKYIESLGFFENLE